MAIISSVFTSLAEAKELSETTKKPIFMVIYDAKHSTNSRLNYSLKWFMDSARIRPTIAQRGGRS
jgi:hypothetical protein